MRKMLARKRATYARQSWKLFTLAGKEDASKEDAMERALVS